MQELRLVAVSEDGTYLVLASAGRGTRFTLPVDDRLRAAVRGQFSRLGQYEIEVENPLRPKEIQARIRSGETAEAIAELAGIPIERVRWFEGPVLQEREYMAQQAQRASVRSPGDSTPGPVLGDLVTDRIGAHQLETGDAVWDSWKREDNTWQLKLAFLLGGEERLAHWVYEPRRRTVAPSDEEALRFSSPDADGAAEPAAPMGATVTPFVPRRTGPPEPLRADGPLPRTAPAEPAAPRQDPPPRQEPAPRQSARAEPAGPAERYERAEPAERRERAERPAARGRTGAAERMRAGLPGSDDVFPAETARRPAPRPEPEQRRAEPERAPAEERPAERPPVERPAPNRGAPAAEPPAAEAPVREHREPLRPERPAVGGASAPRHREEPAQRHREEQAETGEHAAEAPLPAAAAGGSAQPPRRKGRGRRASVPSWDEIMFGAKKSD
ncbi:DUF3071 domain-containing protein [Nocardiopsis sp. CNT-189]|uniref:septation protein SepH n=1 Tax=Nocardiopsis oceanisediminis TaxID=2816862 RepID=UPI003B3494C1